MNIVTNLRCYLCLDFITDPAAMSVLASLVSRLGPGGLLGGAVTAQEVAVRHASKKAGASTRNKCRNTPGKRRGIKIYDGQRVPHG